jgi:ubiquitin carboxyl-terminal hydrolase 25/28
VREKDLPVGLRNIGSTCYFNSLLQVYYSMPQFVTTILNFKDEDEKPVD